MPNTIALWDIPENIPKLEKIIAAHDSPPTTTIVLDNNAAPEKLLPFVGQWGTKENGVHYTITNSFQLKFVEFPEGEIVTKDMHFDGCKLSFDTYCYIEKSEEYKSIIDQSGDHPFSGVRVHSELMLNPDNPNELNGIASSYQIESIKETYIKIQ